LAQARGLLRSVDRRSATQRRSGERRSAAVFVGASQSQLRRYAGDAAATSTSPARGACGGAFFDEDDDASEEAVAAVCEQVAAGRRSRARALAAVARGVAASLPTEVFALFEAAELDEIVCGAADVAHLAASSLREKALYDGVAESDPHVAHFWEALATFDDRELASFVEFCTGSARLPRPDGPRSAQCLKITAPPTGAADNPDDYLPLAQTCFFSLALPKYSSAAVCAAKLRYAIHNAHLMDADFLMRHADGWDALSADVAQPRDGPRDRRRS